MALDLLQKFSPVKLGCVCMGVWWQACLEYGFFYLVNHGIEEELLGRVFEGSKNLFSLPLDEKMKLLRNEGHRGYTPPFAEKLDSSLPSRGSQWLNS